MDDWLDTAIRGHQSAAKRGTWDGKELTPYFRLCRQVHHFAGCLSLFTRDVGYHSSGWWKNPDYERCYHLSLSFFDPITQEPRRRDQTVTMTFIKRLFGRDRRWLWCEPPYSDDGRRMDVWHYRLFCDAGWNPIKPRGEVYDKELTEAGWLSFSDARAAWELQRQREIERVMNSG